MEEGDVIRVAMPQADGRIKKRPAVLLRQFEPFGDCLVCGISSSVRLEVKGFDIVIDSTHTDFTRSGLSIASLVRLGYLTMVEEEQIDGTLGSVSKQTHKLLCNHLADYLRK